MIKFTVETSLFKLFSNDTCELELIKQVHWRIPFKSQNLYRNTLYITANMTNIIILSDHIM